MKIRTILATFVVSIFVLSSVTFAQSSENVATTADENQNLMDDTTASVGITPDNPFYGLDVAWTKLRIIFTFEQKEKAKLGLEIAKKRLLEVREMILKNKADAANTAQREYLDSLETAKAAITSLSSGNVTNDVENEIELEKEVEEHEDDVDKIRNELEIRIFARGDLTAEQQQVVDKILELMRNKTGEIKVKIDEKKEEAKLRIKQVRGLNDTEAINEIKKIEIRQKIFELKSEKALEKIQDAIEEIADVREKLSEINATQFKVGAVNVLLNQADLHLNNSQVAFNNTDFGKAYGQATSANQLAKNAKRLIEKILERSEESEIEVEIENRIAKVEVKIGNREYKFNTANTNRGAIISEVAKRTGLTADKIDNILKIETKNIKPAIIENLKTSIKNKEKEITAATTTAGRKIANKEIETEED